MSDHYPSTNISIKNLKSQNPQSQSTFSVSYIVPLLTTVGVGLSLHTRRVCYCFNGQYWLGTNYWASGYSWTPAVRCQNRPQPHRCRGGSPCSWRRKLRRTGSSTVVLRQYFFTESCSEWSVMLSRMFLIIIGTHYWCQDSIGTLHCRHQSRSYVCDGLWSHTDTPILHTCLLQ